MSPFRCWFLIFAANSITLYYCIRTWVKTRNANPEIRLKFRLIELWAASLSFSLTLALFGILTRSGPATAIYAPMSLVLLIPHQIAAIFLAILASQADPTSTKVAARQSSYDQFVYVFTSAVAGFILPIGSILIVIAGLAVIACCVICSPVVLPIIMLIYLLKYIGGSNKR